jgi:hypothetical protein
MQPYGAAVSVAYKYVLYVIALAGLGCANYQRLNLLIIVQPPLKIKIMAKKKGNV